MQLESADGLRLSVLKHSEVRAPEICYGMALIVGYHDIELHQTGVHPNRGVRLRQVRNRQGGRRLRWLRGSYFIGRADRGCRNYSRHRWRYLGRRRRLGRLRRRLRFGDLGFSRWVLAGAETTIEKQQIDAQQVVGLVVDRRI